jgi:exonuclease VII large subunit
MKKSERENAQQLLESLDPLATLTGRQEDAIKKLLDDEGFKLLVRYMLSEAQGYRVTLSYLNLEDTQMRQQATVIQGKIQGIERLRETVLSLFADEAPTE